MKKFSCYKFKSMLIFLLSTFKFIITYYNYKVLKTKTRTIKWYNYIDKVRFIYKTKDKKENKKKKCAF